MLTKIGCRLRRPSPATVISSLALTLVALLVWAGAALARAPTLLSAGQTSGRITATWSLPPGVVAGLVEVSASPTTGGDGSFVDSEDTDVLGGEETSWTSEGRFAPGTHYVHVSGTDTTCDPCPPDEWSNILRVVVPRPPVPKPRAGRYRGHMEFPDSRPISFTLSRGGRRIRNLTVKFRLDCTIGGFPSGEFRSKGFRFPPIRVRKGGRFSRTRVNRINFRGGPHAVVTVKVTGRLRPPIRARGTMLARARVSDGARCKSPFGRLAWSARHR